ncbi:MAG: hypothetical protein ACLUEJ_13075 [Clostridium sp.]
MKFIGHLDVMRYFRRSEEPMWDLLQRGFSLIDHVLCSAFRRGNHQQRRICGY